MEARSQKIKTVLQSKFIHTERVAELFALALQAEKNVIIWGPAGHAKSEMTETVIEGLGLKDQTFVQFFGEGMTEDKLYGGMDFKKLEKDHQLVYNPENSFLNREYAVFEELFDAPAVVLTALKDTLTAKQMRNGNQNFPMRTKSIICLTNKSPNEISDMGPSAHALVERFPFQLELKWESYKAGDYLSMFNKLKYGDIGQYMNTIAKLVADATKSGNFISPRTAVHALQAVIAAAENEGRDRKNIIDSDLHKLLYIPELSTMASALSTDLKRILLDREADERLHTLNMKLHELDQSHKNGYTTLVSAMKAAKRYDNLRKEADKACLPDHLYISRDDIISACRERIAQSYKIALDQTRLSPHPKHAGCK